MTPKILPPRQNGKGIRGVIAYNEKNASELLAVENFPENDAKALTEYLALMAQQNTRIRAENTPFHVVLPFPPGEVLDDKTYVDIARDYMQGMGYGEQPFAVFLHTDKAHLHLHIVSSRVSAKDFRKIDDYNEKWRSQAIGTIIERKYGITSVLAEKLPKSLSQIADRYFEQVQKGVKMDIGAYFKSWRKLLNMRTLNAENRQKKPAPEVSNKVLAQVNAIVASAMLQKPRSLSQLKKLLEAQRVEVKEVVNQREKRRGVVRGVVFVFHRQAVGQPTIEVAERGIPSGQLPYFAEVALMRQLYANKREYKAVQSYIRKQLISALKRAKNREELQEMLQQHNISTTWHANAGGTYGVSFTYKDTTLKGVQVGKAFSYEKIVAVLDRNAAAVQAAIPSQEQAIPQHFGNIGGSGGSGEDDEEDDDEEQEQEQAIKRRRQ
jgi:hypothetical protein